MRPNMTDEKVKTSSIDSSFPCLLPEDPVLFVSDEVHESHLRHLFGVLQGRERHNQELKSLQDTTDVLKIGNTTSKSFRFRGVRDRPGSTSEIEHSCESNPFEALSETSTSETTYEDSSSDFQSTGSEFDTKGEMSTENANIAFIRSQFALLDLFRELETEVSGSRAGELLAAAWNMDSTATLKVIWNARSIRLGNGERPTLYRCLGWLAQYHPLTMLLNLKWLYLWTIENKAPKKAPNHGLDKDTVMVDASEIRDANFKPGNPDDQSLVENGGAHGYFKDVLNILVLELHGALGVMQDPQTVLNPEKVLHPKRKAKERQDTCDKEKTREKRHELEDFRHKKVLHKFMHYPFYRELHIMVARLFAKQLRVDKELLAGDEQSQSQISLAAKWAPSLERFHDKHTLIATSIAEILFPRSTLFPNSSTEEIPRTTYLKHAREAYRAQYLSPLRAQLAIVERDICAGTFGSINYSRVPSIAMRRYSALFAKKDADRYFAYLKDAATAKAQISSAALLPSLLVKQARESHYKMLYMQSLETQDMEAIADKKARESSSQFVERKWKWLVQSIKDSGKLRSAIAVCDVSGSMASTTFRDGTEPIHSALGLSLLLAEVNQPPFGGGFITFSALPQFEKVGGPQDDRDLGEKLSAMAKSRWDLHADLVAVFEDLVLPMALRNKVAPEDMVKAVIVFSDTDFDGAIHRFKPWNKSNYERIKKAYKEAGYEMPQLVFWNLAAYCGSKEDSPAPKPVDADEIGCALVNGYSEAQLKMFVDEGIFGNEEEDTTWDVVKVNKGKENAGVIYGLMREMISHPAYQMLTVHD